MASQEIIDGHIANLKELKRMGGKAQDVLAYLADPIYNVDKTTAEQIFRDPQFREAFIDTEANTARQAIGQGTLMGGGDELEGFIRGLLPGNTVSKEIDMVRAENELYQRARPYKSLALQVAGGIPTGLVGTGRALARRGVGLLPRILEGGLSGAKTGATSGFLRSEGGLDEEGKIDVLGGLQSRGIGAATGAGTGAVTGRDCYAVAFPVETVVTNLDTGSNVTGTDSNLHQTYMPGTTLFLSFTAITISSGLALIYKNDTL